MTFTYRDGTTVVTVDDSFLRRCPNPELEEWYTLFHTFSMGRFLHNPKGPAIHNLVTQEKTYYLHGEKVDSNMVESLVFNEQMDKFLNDEQ
jgi:hypothetical protein